MSQSSVYRWNGKIVSHKVYLQRLQQRELGLKRKKVSAKKSKIDACGASDDFEEPVTSESVAEKNEILDGRRIVDLKFLGQQLWCISCKDALSLDYVESERRIGLASILMVRCHKCLLINEISTDKQKSSVDRRSLRHHVNYKTVIGSLHGGLGWTHLQKLFICMNIPYFDFRTYKKYENEVGLAAEDVAKESCQEAAKLEKEKTVEQSEALRTQLPTEFQSNFIIHRRISNEVIPVTESSTASTLIDSSRIEESNSQDGNETASWDDVVRIIVSYDMGWSTRGTGRQYDSKNGFGAIIGSLTGLVLDFSTCNRICATCDRRDSASNHDNCRKNFYGSAKAMEPYVAKKLVVDSDVLRAENIEVGVLVGDDDSSTIAACRAAANHSIIKQSDTNHTSGGVKKKLYNIQKNHKELTKDRIIYLHRCFTYALAQNKGDSLALSKAIESIPYHAFNDHSKCGTWCGYKTDPENYVHKVIPGGFEDEILLNELKSIFDKLAANAQKFCNGASSNANESLNAMMASKAPKSRCYSRTASADYRFACVVGQKNIGEGYTQKIAQKMTLSPGKHHTRHVLVKEKALLKRRALIKTHAYKKRRMQVKKLRTMLRHKKENQEGVTYKSNCSLLTESAVPENEAECEDADLEDDNCETLIIILDLETSGFEADCDILQIAAKCRVNNFSTYINPVQQISTKATEAHGLINCSGELFYNGKRVSSVHLRLALINLLEWLKSLKKQCCIATHNLAFDGPRLFRALAKNELVSEFSSVIYGFVDTLQVIRKVTGKKSKGSCTIVGLADSLNIARAGAHNAIHDCAILHKILKKLSITNITLLESAMPFSDQVKSWESLAVAKKNLASLLCMQNGVSLSILQKLARAGITMDILRSKHDASNKKALETFLINKIKEKQLQSMHQSSIEKIIDWFSSY